jgi:glycine/D-amino acid oxidase-like deaminating enzyme
MFNFITGGRKMRKTWQGDRFMAALHRFMREETPRLAEAYFHPQLIYRPFQSVAEYNEWCGAATLPAFAEEVRIRETPYYPQAVANPWGGLEILSGGWLDLPPYLRALQATMQAFPAFEYRAEPFRYQALEPESGKYGDAALDAVVFAEGVAANQNPYWWVAPLRPLKGELLTVALPGLALDRILSRGGYLLPVGRDADGEAPVYYLGSTYEHAYTDAAPSQHGRQQLLVKLAGMLGEAAPAPHVLGHYAGLRPTTPDRRPLLGRHPHYDRLFFLNGLGTTGILRIAWLSALLRDQILQAGASLPWELAMERLAGRDQAQA